MKMISRCANVRNDYAAITAQQCMKWRAYNVAKGFVITTGGIAMLAIAIFWLVLEPLLILCRSRWTNPPQNAPLN